ncbi:LysR family transcriptional regulator [Clostridium beijerinckii]|uniref:LysR family transcriptional regulator n=1 Tax=Clostridium beijerinckii TaxID=1520 RepID=UPI0014940C2A|nr:LysR family transcriptional regulator [Clostridium beijerinckii]NOW05261.1 DNA-binding transcriptional LysR family regulator [Clostridium beijerinckii]NYC01597.1 DNA-binding transcriptional LysR family regulator [Clostridium beijerinckii]
MDIRHFKTFKSIIEEGNFSNAAMKLGYTQSTVTSQIQQLEQELSIKLFEKIGRNMVLTPLGKELIPYADELLNTVKKIESIGKYGDNITGELKIAVAESLMSYKLQNVLAMFKEEAPNVRLSMVALNCYDIKNMLASGEIDLGLMYNVGSKNESLNAVKLSDFDVALVCAPQFEQEKLDFSTPNQKINTSLIINEVESIYRKILESYFFDKNIFLDNTIELGSIEAIKKCVASNLGISFLPRFTIEEELENGKLKELKAGDLNAKITAIYAYHKNKWISPAMSLFIELVRKDFNIQ